ncbi:MAG: GNAT family N-acetyltransferase [Bacteroidetes bacterium]|nr:GNAT family N-acetyltransferase [Bacteroidota bacterium]
MRQFGDFCLLGHAQINRVRWDECISSAANSLVYAKSWYLDVATNQQWDAIVYGDYEFVMPLPFKKKMGVRYMPTPPFIQQLGIFGPQPADEELCDAFISIALKSVSFIELNFNWMNHLPAKAGYEIKTRTNLILDLKPGYEQIRLNYSDNLIRNIRKAEKAGLRFNSTSMRSVIKLFRDDRGATIETATDEWYNTVDQLYNVAALRNAGSCYGAYNSSGVLVAGMFILKYQSRYTFIFSGNSEEGKTYGALPALIDYFIKTQADESFLFDFEGSDDEGLRRFYESFGAVTSNYVHLKINQLPFYLRWLKS